MKRIKKTFAALFAVSAVLLMSTSVFAMTGSGTESSPYVATTFNDVKTAFTNGGHVKLGNDITTDGSTLVIEKNVTLELAGHTLKSTEYKDNYNLISLKSGTFTVNDSVGNGSIVSDGNVYSIYTYGGKFVLNGGTIINSLSDISAVVCSSETVINGGSIDTLRIIPDGTTVINGGKIGIIDVPSATYDPAALVFNNGEADKIYFGDLNKNTAIINAIVTGCISIPASNANFTLYDVIARTSNVKIGTSSVNTETSKIEAGDEPIVISSSRDTIVDEVSVNINAPQAGKRPDMSPVVKQSDAVRPSLSYAVKWYENGNEMNESDVFTLGNSYSVTVPVEAKTNCAFLRVGTRYIVNAAINDNSAEFNNIINELPWAKATVSYNFGTLEKTVIKHIDVTVREPKAGSPPAYTADVSEGCLLNEDMDDEGVYGGIAWYDLDEGKYLTRADVMAEGHEYQFVAYFKPDQYSTFNIKTATINGKTTAPYGSSKKVFVIATFKIPLYGDVDDDGDVDKADAVLLLKYLSGTEELSESQLAAAKVTDSTKASPDLRDVAAILKKL